MSRHEGKVECAPNVHSQASSRTPVETLGSTYVTSSIGRMVCLLVSYVMAQWCFGPPGLKSTAAHVVSGTECFLVSHSPPSPGGCQEGLEMACVRVELHGTNATMIT